VKDKQGLTFASVLRSTLRQDPDVILVGEIRDQETAQIAVQAAQTGHLVLSTLHTNDAASTVTRLIDLGVDAYSLANCLVMIVAQRLVRRVCPSCSVPYAPDEESRRMLRLDDETKYRRGAGCSQCRHTGYTGRIGVYELLPFSPSMAKIVESGGSDGGLRQQARLEGYHSLPEDALEKLSAGITTAEEVLRVVQVTDQKSCCPHCQGQVDPSFFACPHCGGTLRATCDGCGKPLTSNWAACPFCGRMASSRAAPVAPAAISNGAPAVGVAAAAVAAPPALARKAPAEEARQRTFKALVVDDDPDLRRIVRMTLERADLGLTVITAQDGPEALALAEIERPDIVILDLSMPNMDGFAVCRELRSDVRTAFVPVMMLTAEGSEESVSKGFQAGTDDYVVKPFRREDLLARLRRMIERTYGRVGAANGDGLSREVAA
jgi:CheY-like chemotaxis protein